MQMQIHVKGLPRSARVRRFASLKLIAALTPFSHAIETASMHLGDINGPERGGVDKLCRVVLRMRNSSVVVIEDLGSDIAKVIERVTGRLQQSVSRQLRQLVKVDRNGMRPYTFAAAGA